MQTYRVAVCDDEEMTCAEITEALSAYGKRKGTGIASEVFRSGEAFMESVEKGAEYDVVFLDIALGGMDGVEAGRKLREEREDNVTQVVYISAEQGHSMRLFAVRPLDFLVKPFGGEEIGRVMDLYIRLYGKKGGFFEYQTGKQRNRIAEREILYFRSNARKIEMVTAKGEKEFYGRMQDVEKELDGGRFWRVHKSYIINTGYISEYRCGEIVLSGGDVVPVSQAYRGTVRRKIMELEIAGRS